MLPEKDEQIHEYDQSLPQKRAPIPRDSKANSREAVSDYRPDDRKRHYNLNDHGYNTLDFLSRHSQSPGTHRW